MEEQKEKITISITLNTQLVKLIDEQSKKEDRNRSSWIRVTLQKILSKKEDEL